MSHSFIHELKTKNLNLKVTQDMMLKGFLVALIAIVLVTADTTGTTTTTGTGSTTTGTTTTGTTTTGTTTTGTATTTTTSSVTFTDLPLGTVNTTQFTGCVAYKVAVGFAKPILTLSQSLDEVTVIISEWAPATLSTTTLPACTNNGSYCEERKAKVSNITVIGTKCLSTLYVYACNPSSTLSTLQVRVDASSDSCAITPNPPSEATCLAKTKSACYQESTCDPGCRYVECTVGPSPTANKTFGFCLPSNFSEADTKSRCETDADFKVATQKSSQIYRCGAEPDGNGGSSILAGILAAVIIVIVLVLLASCFYRYKLSNEHVPPFTPPRFCPNILFPRPYGEPEVDATNLERDSRYKLLNK
eukprot:TRINITY_DN1570_c0_g1_i2.p1 TRINITY_DN1570_c0_g1~~TRINITY_DN1570_c0_g1_i2.p1  ORF type:complete len:361 (+),score=55.88 TRINITY_DN1570_c0_g1_i2:144-1226(+)